MPSKKPTDADIKLILAQLAASLTLRPWRWRRYVPSICRPVSEPNFKNPDDCTLHNHCPENIESNVVTDINKIFKYELKAKVQNTTMQWEHDNLLTAADNTTQHELTRAEQSWQWGTEARGLLYS
jgi:hypothetical protein